MTDAEVSKRYPDAPRWAMLADYSSAEVRYNIAVEPMLRRLEAGWVTRNRYDAECLNSPILFSADIDFRSDHATIPCPDIVRQLCGSGDMTGALTIEPLRLVEDRLRQLLADPIGEQARSWARFAVESGADFGPEAALLLLEQLGYLEKLGFRLYESRNGFRVICSTMPFRLETETQKGVAWHLQSRLLCDPAYQAICKVQGLFRLRLTPKPWRSRSGTARAARYIGTYGSDEIDPVLAPIIAEHDRVACVDQLGRADAELA